MYVALVMATDDVKSAMEQVQLEHVADAVEMEDVAIARAVDYVIRAMATLNAPHAGEVQNVRRVAVRVIVLYAMVSPNAVPVEVMAIVPSVITVTESVPIVMA